MIGAILGDIIGSPYEFDMGDKTKDFPLFSKHSMFTDDTVMTAAVADAFLKVTPDTSNEYIKQTIIRAMREYGSRYPHAGYGARFSWWLTADTPQPYNSYGNGSAMRVSSVAWLFNDLNTVREAARLSAEVTHNHPEGIKGAEATASAIYLARTGHSKEYIREYIETEFDYVLNRTCDEIRPEYHHVESCMETVPEAITAFLEGDNFEDVIRTAVSLGGDCDTLTAIAGSIAEGFYGVPSRMKYECYSRLPSDLRMVLVAFEAKRDNIHLIYSKDIESYLEDGFILVSGETVLIKDCSPCGEYLASRGVLLLEGCNSAMDLYYPTREKPLRIIFDDNNSSITEMFRLIRKCGYRIFDAT